MAESETNTALEAREAKVLIQSHIADCARRYKETSDTLIEIRHDMATLLELSGAARGRMEQNRALLGAIPNAFWTIVIAICGSAATVVATRIWMVMGKP